MLAKALTAAFGGDVEQMSKGSVQRFEAGEVRLKFRPGQTNETGQVVMYAGPPVRGNGVIPPALKGDEALATLAKARETVKQAGFKGDGDVLKFVGPQLTLARGNDWQGEGAIEIKRADGQPFTEAQATHLFDKLENLIAGYGGIPFRGEGSLRVSMGAGRGGDTSIMIFRDEDQKVTLRATNDADLRLMQNVFNQLFDR